MRVAGKGIANSGLRGSSLFKSIELGQLIKPAKVQKCGMEKYPVLSMTMHDGLIFQSDKFTKEVASKDKSEYKVVFRNQLVVGFPIDEGVLAAQRVVDIGVVSPAYSIWNINQDQVEPEFLEYALRSNRAIEYYKAYLRGSTARRRSLPKETLLAYKLDLPSLKEQKYILRVLHQAGEIITQRTLQVKRLNQLINGRFVEMFGDPVLNTQNREVCPFKKFMLDIRYGISQPPDFSEDGEYKFIRATNIKNGRIFEQNMLRISKDEAKKIEKCKLKGNEIIIVRSGANTGDTCVVTSDYREQYAGYDIIITLNLEKANPIFFNELLNTHYMQNIIKPLTARTAQPHINTDQVQNLPMIVAPLIDQERFADFVHQVDKSKFVIQKSIDKLQLLFDSLMQQYFG